jgi:hypothetical protein
VFIEGEQAIGERERYRRITGLNVDTRFLESGPCSEVLRRLATVQTIGLETGNLIRAAGIIDRDWRPKQEIEQLSAKLGVIALQVHEIENFLLHPQTVERIARQNGFDGFDYEGTLRRACDQRAGGWILQNSTSSEKYRDISDLPTDAKSFGYALAWEDIEPDPEHVMAEIGARSGFGDVAKRKLIRVLTTFSKVYARIRTEQVLWKECEGKEVAKMLAPLLGFSDLAALERAVYAYWDEDPTRIPSELSELRQALSNV